MADNETPAKSKNLYEVLGIKKDATDDDIKRAYRKLALRYHPDKNLDGDPEKTEKFKEINHANSILSNPYKRKIYNEYGDMGLSMMDHFGEDFLLIALKPWVKWCFIGVGILTCGFGCCCCGCMFCCNFCCGKCKPEHIRRSESQFDEMSRAAAGEDPIVTQPTSSSTPIVVGMPLGHVEAADAAETWNAASADVVAVPPVNTNNSDV